jgi:hypothetical protein
MTFLSANLRHAGRWPRRRLRVLNRWLDLPLRELVHQMFLLAVLSGGSQLLMLCALDAHLISVIHISYQSGGLLLIKEFLLLLEHEPRLFELPLGVFHALLSELHVLLLPSELLHDSLDLLAILFKFLGVLVNLLLLLA